MRFANHLVLLLLSLFLFLPSKPLDAQTRTVGKIFYNDSSAFLGYTLFTPNQSFKTYMVENCGLEVHQWYSAFQPGMTAYLRTDGLLLRTGRDYSNAAFPSNGGNGGYLELLDWWSQRQWVYKVSDAAKQAHHDVCPMPNGNILVLAWEKHDQNACIAAGRDPNQLADNEIWSEAVYELQPIFPDSAIIAWEWHSWDHLIQDFDQSKANFDIVTNHPELLDLNYLGISLGHADWLHANSIAYNPGRDEIVLSFRETSEIVVIDHSTTSAVAAMHTGGNSGKGGDFLYRWGNPEVYRRGGTVDQRLFQQHNAHWIDDTLRDGGKLIVFNNGFARPGGNSSVEFIAPELDSNSHYAAPSASFLPTSANRTFVTLPGDTIDSGFMGGAQVLPNGNLFISQAVHGRMVEFDTLGNRAWEYISPVLPLSLLVSQGQPVPANGLFWANAVFKGIKIDPNFQGLEGQPLPHGDPVEYMPWPETACSTPVGLVVTSENTFEIFPNPVTSALHIRSNVPQKTTIELMDGFGRSVERSDFRSTQAEIDLTRLPAGIYFLRIGKNYCKKIAVSR